MAKSMTMDRNLALEVVRVTEAAALSAATLMGRGDEKAADQAAVDAMRRALNSLAIEGTVVIGEGERDEAPMLFIGEKAGSVGPKVDSALEPLDGTTITAKGGHNALAVVAMAAEGGSSTRPTSIWKDRRRRRPARALSISMPSPSRTPPQLAKARKVEVSDIVACILDRPRHAELIARALGGRPHRADLRWRRQRRDRHLAAG